MGLLAMGAITPPITIELKGPDLLIELPPGGSGTKLFEILPHEAPLTAPGKPVEGFKRVGNTLGISAANRESNGFYLVDPTGKRLGPAQFVTRWDKSADPEKGLPKNLGIKGLQVQMLEDALALGIHHAALNVNLAQLIRVPAQPGDETLALGDKTIGFRNEVLQGMPIKTYTDKGIRVYLILLAYRSGNREIDSLLLHPEMLSNAPNHLGAFNTATPEGVRVFDWVISCMAKRMADPQGKQGRVAGWIVGNEINAHHEWYNRGPASPEEVVGDYHRALRLAHGALMRSGAPGRIYVSLEHHWTMKPGPDPKQSLPGKEFLTRLLELSKAHGDFGWNLAHHPYPENLFEPRTWLDKQALPNPDSPKMTFKNLDQLSTWMDRPETQFQGAPRRLILSEQGFHSPTGPEGQKRQAAGYVYAFEKIQKNPKIEAFILHRHVDHAIEGGLNLGLWTNKPGQICTPDQKKLLWQVFHDAGTPAQETTFGPYREMFTKPKK